jgi:hypothetical protein
VSVLAWVIVVAIAWMAVAAVVGVLVGRAVRLRDRQVPRDQPSVPDDVPEPRRSTTPPHT